jgi:hypothetical protein
MSLQKVKVNLSLGMERLRSNDAFRTPIEFWDHCQIYSRILSDHEASSSSYAFDRSFAGPQSKIGFGDEKVGKSPYENWNPVIHTARYLFIKGSLSAYSVAINVTFLIVKETNKNTPQSR